MHPERHVYCLTDNHADDKSYRILASVPNQLFHYGACILVFGAQLVAMLWPAVQHAAASQVDLWAAICVGIYCNNIKLKRNMIKKLVKTQNSSGLGFESLPFD